MKTSYIVFAFLAILTINVSAYSQSKLKFNIINVETIIQEVIPAKIVPKVENQREFEKKLAPREQHFWDNYKERPEGWLLHGRNWDAVNKVWWSASDYKLKLEWEAQGYIYNHETQSFYKNNIPIQRSVAPSRQISSSC